MILCFLRSPCLVKPSVPPFWFLFCSILCSLYSRCSVFFLCFRCFRSSVQSSVSAVCWVSVGLAGDSPRERSGASAGTRPNLGSNLQLDRPWMNCKGNTLLTFARRVFLWSVQEILPSLLWARQVPQQANCLQEGKLQRYPEIERSVPVAGGCTCSR